MRYLFSVVFVSVAVSALAQENYSTNSQALRIVKENQERESKKDSLKSVFKGKWTLNVGFGNRYINGSNLSDQIDTVLFADFSDISGALNFGAGKFVTKRFWLNTDITITIPKRDQEITSFSFGNNGLSVEGEGSGGLMLGVSFIGKYYLKEWKHSRFYIGGGLGALNLRAKGGEISFSASNGQNMNLEEASSRYLSTEILTGLTLRPSQILLFDAEFGYNFTTTDEPIGRIISPGGFTTAFTLSFILNANKK